MNICLTTLRRRLGVSVALLVGLVTFGEEKAFAQYTINRVASNIIPTGVAADSLGNVYVADVTPGVGKIWKVSPSGAKTVVAGGGTYLDDFGGSALSDELVNPQSVAVDLSGNFYAGASGVLVRVTNGTLYQVTKDYVGPAGLAADNSGNLFYSVISWPALNVPEVRETQAVTSYPTGDGNLVAGGAPITCGGGQIVQPTGVAVDMEENLYVADAYCNVIWKVAPGRAPTIYAGSSTFISGFAGDGYAATSALLGHPSGVALDIHGNLYIADSANSRIREVTTDGIITTIAGGSVNGVTGNPGCATSAGETNVAATSAALQSPYAISVGPAGIYFSDKGLGVVCQLTPPSIQPPTISMTVSPSSLPKSGGWVVLSGVAEGFAMAVENAQLTLTEKQVSPLVPCTRNPFTGVWNCPSPIQVGSESPNLSNGSPQPFSFSVYIPPLPVNYPYAITDGFTATLTTPTGTASAFIEVTEY